MKKLLLFTAVSLLSLATFAQTATDNKKLLKKYSASEIESMDIATLRFNTYCIDNAFQIVDFPGEKSGKVTLDGEKTIANISAVNFYDLNVELKEEQYQYFSIQNTDKLLIVKPVFLIKSEIK